MSALHDRRWLVNNKLPGATLAHPDRDIAIVNVHDRAGHQDLGRHPFRSPARRRRPSGAIFCGEHHRHSMGTKGECGAAAEEGVQAGLAVGGWCVVWKPKPYFRKVRNTLNRSTAANAAAMPS